MAAWGSSRSISHKGLRFDGGIPYLMGTQFTINSDEGKVVKVSGNKTVDLCAENDLFDGVVIAIADGICTVQDKGYVTVKYSGTAPTAGRVKLEAKGDGSVQVDATNGREYLVTDVDTTNKVCTFLLG